MNSFLYRKILTPRKLSLSYTSPPICEGEFSATGVSELSLLPIYKKRGPTGLIMDWTGSYWRLSWNRYPGALCYSVYKLSESEFIVVAECIFDTFLDLDVFGPGTYVVTVITPDGESEESDPIETGSEPEPPVPPCPPETGDPCPTGPTAFNITLEYAEHPDDSVNWPDVDQHNPVLWDEFEFLPDHVWPEPLDPNTVAYELPGDYPPGEYNLRYVSGFEEGTVTGFCVPPTDFQGWAAVYYVGDDEHRGVVMGELAIISNLRDVDNSPPPPWAADIDYFDSGTTLCAINLNVLNAAVLAWFNPAGYMRVWRSETAHSNTGGPLRAVWDGNGFGPFDRVPTHPFMLRLVQISGLIQQARSLRVQSWATIGASFSATLASDWVGGLLETRSAYTSTTCTWTQPANGGFGGASIYYTQAHPTSPNGCGWVIDIYEGATLVWRGYKTVGETGAGMYYRDAAYTFGLPCITIENNEYWDYPV